MIRAFTFAIICLLSVTPSAMPSPVVSLSGAIDFINPLQYGSLNSIGETESADSDLHAALEAQKTPINERLHEATSTGSAFRPDLVSDLIKQRTALPGETAQARDRMSLARLEHASLRRQALQGLAESTEPLSFSLLMSSMHKAFGQKIAENNIEFQRQIVAAYPKPFLRPVISFFAPDGLTNGATVESKIYQDLEEKKGTLLKDKDIFVVTKISKFSGDSLHLGVDFYGVKETAGDTQALTGSLLEDELDLQEKILDSQIGDTERILDRQKKILTKMAQGIASVDPLAAAEDQTEKEIALAERKLQLQISIAKKQIKVLQTELLKQQKALLQKQIEAENYANKVQKRLLEEALDREMKALEDREMKALEDRKDLAKTENEEQSQHLKHTLNEHIKAVEKPKNWFGKAIGTQYDVLKDQLEQGANSTKLERDPTKNPVDVANGPMGLNNDLQQRIIIGLNYIRQKVDNVAKKQAELRQKKLEEAAKLAEQQREPIEKHVEKQQDFFEKQLEKKQDALDKQTEKEADPTEKLMEKEEDQAEKLVEKEQDQIDKQLKKQGDAAKWQAELVQIQLAKEQDLFEKQLEMETNATEKPFEPMQRQVEKQRDLVDKEAEPATEQTDKSQDQFNKQVEKETDVTEKQADYFLKPADSHQVVFMIPTENKLYLAEKQLEKEQDPLGRQADALQKQIL